MGGRDYDVKNSSKNDSKAENNTVNETDLDLTKILPELRQEGFYGVIGRASLILCEGYRAHPNFTQATLMSRLAASIHKGNVVVKNGAQTTEIRINSLLIMRTGGGKGMSEGRASLLIEHSMSRAPSQGDDNEHTLFSKVHDGGIATAEGLIYELKDEPHGEESANDKRRCIVEEEWVNTLIKCRTNGSTLSPVIRKLFDGGSFSPMIKHDRITSTSPHVCFVGHITPSEFLAEIKATEISNGFNNRFLTIYAVPKAVIPFPKDLDTSSLDKVATELADAIHWCNDEKRVLEMAPCFKELWAVQAFRLDQLGPPESLESKLLARAAHYALIISGLFAALEKSTLLKKEHLVAALAWIDYWQSSIRYVFNTEAEALENKKLKKREELVLETIILIAKKHPSRSFNSSELTVKLKNKLSGPEISVALQGLQERPTSPILITETGSFNRKIIELL